MPTDKRSKLPSVLPLMQVAKILGQNGRIFGAVFGAQPGGFGEDDVNLYKVGPEPIVINGVIFAPISGVITLLLTGVTGNLPTL